MADPIYDLYLGGDNERRKLLLVLRRLARSAGLNNHGIGIRSVRSKNSDGVEVRADAFAREMRRKPGLHARLRGKAKVSSIIDIHLESFAKEHGPGKVIIGLRAVKTIAGKQPIMVEKAKKNSSEERRLGVEIKSAGSEVSSCDKRPALGLEHKDNAPINLAKPIREITIADIRALLNVHNCDGVTALKVLTVAVFAKQSDKLSPRLTPSPRSQTRSREQGFKQMQRQLIEPGC